MDNNPDHAAMDQVGYTGKALAEGKFRPVMNL